MSKKNILVELLDTYCNSILLGISSKVLIDKNELSNQEILNK